jgi:mono/diheme cytochrome c family protein
MIRFVPAIAFAAALLGSPGATLAQLGPGDAQSGLRLAQQWCAECHVITRDQTRAPNAGVPTWPSIADNPATTEFRLRAFFQTPHQNMPNIALSRGQTDDIITYILSLKAR